MNEQGYLSAVLNPLQDYGEVWPVLRLVLPTLGHDAVAGRAEQEMFVNGRSCGMCQLLMAAWESQIFSTILASNK